MKGVKQLETVQLVERIVSKMKSLIYGKILWPVENKETYIEFQNPEDARRWSEEYYGQWSRAYLERERLVERVKVKVSLCHKPMEKYCGHVYRNINKLLRNSLDDGCSIWRTQINLIIRDLLEAPRIPSNLVLYRLVNDDFIVELVNNNNAKNPMPTQEKGFMSTSLCKDIVNSGDHYAKYNNLLKIYVDKGTVGAYMNMIAGRTENEILLLPNMYLALAEFPYMDLETGKTIFECKLLSDL